MNNTIKAKVVEFITAQKMFTSVNIGNAIKKDGTWIANHDVAEWLRSNFDTVNKEIGDSYTSTSIPVNNDTERATLYYPFFADPINYNDRNAQATTPDEFEKDHGYKSIDPQAQPKTSQCPAGSMPSTPLAAAVITAPPTPTPTPAAPTPVALDKSTKKAKKTKSTTKKVKKTKSTKKAKAKKLPPVINIKQRKIKDVSQNVIRIPTAFIKALGLKPGDSVAASRKVLIKGIPNTLRVHKDYRVGIPRACLSLKKRQTVHIFMRDGKIGIEKVTKK